MHKSIAWVLGVSFIALGCGGSPAVDPVQPEAHHELAPSEAQHASDAAADGSGQGAAAAGESGGKAQPSTTPVDPRETALAEINRHAYGEDVEDAYSRARIAAAGLSETELGLHPQQVKALAAVVSPAIDPSQCSRIFRETVRETALEAVEARCGSFAALQKQVEAAPAKSQAKVLVTACKFKLGPQLKLEAVDPWALLLSEVVLEQLGSGSKEAQRTTEALVYVCSPGDE